MGLSFSKETAPLARDQGGRMQKEVQIKNLLTTFNWSYNDQRGESMLTHSGSKARR